MARLCVAGLWHLGTVAAAALASLGHDVRATDLDAEVVRRIEAGQLPVFEPGLAESVAREQAAGRLKFVASIEQACASAEAVFLTLDTPVNDRDESDLAPILATVDAIAAGAARGVLIVVMSQVPAGTCRQLSARLNQRAPQLAARVVYHPENLRLGQALETFLRPDFRVVGAETSADAARLLSFYPRADAPALAMNLESAEMAKHALNAFLATSISFINELASLAEAAGADIRDVARALRHDSRIGPRAFLNPGPGFSGGTLGRDVQNLRRLARRAGCGTRQLDATLAVNRERLPNLAARIAKVCGGLEGREIALLGLTYKPGTDTLRRSPALELARLLRQAGASVRAWDPQVGHAAQETSGIAVADDAYIAARGADAAVLITPWPEMRALDWPRVRREMRAGVVLDAHNFLDAAALEAAGFRYFGVGIAARPVARVRAGGAS